ncbi:MAG TPA: terminase TerL endonuclease subunit [Candidatus Binataceae bacterium]|nr:terminase TerL endonuclease subunit [Candidatus Binataceae bacterium]
MCIFDELWAYVSERAHRLWDEAIPSPARKVSGRLTVSYAGFEGESELLESLYKRGIEGEQIAPDLYRRGGLLMFWTHQPPAPWQTVAWLSQMREQHRPNAYLRQIENRWVSSESSFIPIEWWDACADSTLSPIVKDSKLAVWLGVDASVKRDSTAIVACAWDDEHNRVRLAWHRIFQPSIKNPLDFEDTIEAALLESRERFNVREIRYDPYQLVSVAQRLAKRGLPMVEFAQSVPNLTEASSNLYEILKGRNLMAYPDADIRLAMSRAVAVENPRGWKISKEKTSHKIDVVVALAQAALGAVQGGQHGEPALLAYTRQLVENAERQAPEGSKRPAGFSRPKQAEKPGANPYGEIYSVAQRLGGLGDPGAGVACRECAEPVGNTYETDGIDVWHRPGDPACKKRKS